MSQQHASRRLFILSVFLGSFLLFQVQPLIGKYLLPWFGGVPSVWTVCLLFFQTALLGGYLYAHALQYLSVARQGTTHIILLTATIVATLVMAILWGNPILPADHLKPVDDTVPTWRIVFLLASSIGPAYFLLSTGASLFQAWHHHTYPDKAPWFVYALSNGAALLALLSYPFLIEPLLSIRMQAWIWSIGFLFYALACIRCGRLLRTLPARDASNSRRCKEPRHAAPGLSDYLLWTALAAAGVLSLMSITNQITQDVPPVPFLWILSLTLYLLSYIIGFVDRWKKRHGMYIGLFVLAGIIAWALVHYSADFTLPMQIAAYSFILFSSCLFCHHTLYRSKPHPSHLTGFYLCISLGGVLGGLFVAVLAPRIFSMHWEYQLSLVVIAVLAAVQCYRIPESRLHKFRHAAWPLVLLFSAAVFHPSIKEAQQAVYKSRNFFGALRIMQFRAEEQVLNLLYNGQTQHGGQYNTEPLRYYPTAYYTQNSGIGQVLLKHPKRYTEYPLHVGVVGLGVGTLATYGKEGDTYRMYEINPDVIELACSSSFFSYVNDSRADIQIVEGDARIQLEKELKTSGSHQFDILALDAFTSDSIPVHLLTKEAFELYLQHLAPGGLIAVHVSNKYLDLIPLLSSVANTFNLQHVFISHLPDTDIAMKSAWFIAGRQSEFPPTIPWTDRKYSPDIKSVRIWTDDFSSLLSLF